MRTVFLLLSVAISIRAENDYDECDFEKSKKPYAFPGNDPKCPDTLDEYAWGAVCGARESVVCRYDCFTACEGCDYPVFRGDATACRKTLTCMLASTHQWYWIWHLTSHPVNFQCGVPLATKCKLPGVGGITVPLGWRGVDLSCQKGFVVCNKDQTTTALRYREIACPYSCFNKVNFRDRHGYSCDSWSPDDFSGALSWGMLTYTEEDMREIRQNCPGAKSPHCRISRSRTKQRHYLSR